MSRKHSWRAAVLLLAAALALAPAHPVEAALLVLTERDRSEAIRVGKRSVQAEEFGAEWKVAGVGGQSVVVMTAFHRLALAARNSAFQNRELKPRDIDSLLKEYDGKLIFWATLRGAKADFARFYAPALLVQQEEIRPTFTQNERTAKPDEDGRFTARCIYVFPSEGLDPMAKLLLVVRDPDERQVARFTVDLSAMR
ncbi:MAG TPA: hypothetical protein VGR44_06890 [Methylomirabilota bacterium]|nr:hypothetical protein [Methylomirabilota bacterium]